jgi:hypothetical protein
MLVLRKLIYCSLCTIVVAYTASGSAAESPNLTSEQDARAMAQRSSVYGSQMAPGPDPELAVQEEFEAARRAGTAEAYEFFIKRHPEHSLAQTARRERERSKTRRVRPNQERR